MATGHRFVNQLRKNEDDEDELFEKKSVERRRWTKVRKEAERRMAEEAARRKAEEEAKRKAEVEAQRRAEAEAKACAEEVARAQTEFDLGPVKGETAEGDGERDRGGRGVGRGLTPVLRVLGHWGVMQDEGGWEQQGEVMRPLSPTAEQVRAAGGCAAVPAEEAGGGDVAAVRKEEGADEESDGGGR
ncbi:hypothetical protein PAXRUDRAFT_22625 [Paxillus rubicundulus Ve08.2h10]|uniref:Uncharacterized protein n=1 Tax=Paxillus rubicundulus Ve08.2h10 TaxID=930991 RepID=A0A0D0BJU7_9AGAM|nr:hypothetical protein PAXRUDRAFT_22625 [Paxillus rubicundulus Ve08.2h10]